MSATFLVIIPTHDHARYLPYAVRGVLRQSVQDFELVVIGDGVNDETRAVMADFCRTDPRVRFLDRPKSPRTGEQYRNELLATSDHTYVAYTGDDDILFPEHLAEVRARLETCDLVHGYGCYVGGDEAVGMLWTDLGRDDQRGIVLGGRSLVSLTGVAHTMEAYRRLPHGWRTTPEGTFTDQYMIQQFLEEPTMKAGVIPVPTSVRFPSQHRLDWTVDERERELADWEERILTRSSMSGAASSIVAATYAQGIDNLAELDRVRAMYVSLEGAYRAVDAEASGLRERLGAMERTRTWRLRDRIARLLRR